MRPAAGTAPRARRSARRRARRSRPRPTLHGPGSPDSRSAASHRVCWSTADSRTTTSAAGTGQEEGHDVEGAKRLAAGLPRPAGNIGGRASTWRSRSNTRLRPPWGRNSSRFRPCPSVSSTWTPQSAPASAALTSRQVRSTWPGGTTTTVRFGWTSVTSCSPRWSRTTRRKRTFWMGVRSHSAAIAAPCDHTGRRSCSATVIAAPPVEGKANGASREACGHAPRRRQESCWSGCRAARDAEPAAPLSDGVPVTGTCGTSGTSPGGGGARARRSRR